MTDTPRKPKKLPVTREIPLSDQEYQPPEAEQQREYDMLGAPMKQVRNAFFRPIT